MTSDVSDVVLVLGLLAGGAVAGLQSRWWPLNGWAALALPLLFPPLGIGLAAAFC